MPILENLFRDDLLTEKEDDLLAELYDEGEAVALEDLLHLVQEYSEFQPSDLRGHSGESRTSHFVCDEDALVWGLSVLCETRLGRDLAFDARFEDWSIEVDDIDSGVHIIDPQLRILILPRFSASPSSLSYSQADRALFVMELARGLRGIWHDMTGVRDNADLSADDQILWNRLRQADHDLCALRMAWELREQGMGGLWRQIIASPLGDFAIIAGEVWQMDIEENEDEALPLYAFPHLVLEWLKDRALVNLTDSRTLDMMDVRLQRSSADVCGPAHIHPNEIMKISVLPADGAYLAPVARTILYSPEFRNIPDPVNEAYLRQILEDCDVSRAHPLVFSDSELQKKIFPEGPEQPNFIIDTIA